MIGSNDLNEETKTAIRRICRVLGDDRVRSIVYFTHSESDVIYLRNDLSADETIIGFADNERGEFTTGAYWQTIADTDNEYCSSIHVFENTYLVAFTADQKGLLIAVDGTPVPWIDELNEPVSGIL